MSELVDTIVKVLEGADLVLGWKRDPVTGVAAPARFKSKEEASGAIFDSTCVHNLAVHLPRLKDRNIGIVAKGCDARSVVELIVEHELSREQVKVIGVGCGGMLDVKKIWRAHGYGATIEDRGETLLVGGKEVDRGRYARLRCRKCRDADQDIYDIRISEGSGEPAARQEHELEKDFAAMTPGQRREFWRQQFSRCIRCYACRESCPMCFCRDVCIMQTQVPHWAGGEVNARESEMIQLIRVSHLAGRCTGCGECERACPVGIPLMLLMDEQNIATEDLFGYSAGSDLEARPPLLTFDVKRDLWEDEQ